MFENLTDKLQRAFKNLRGQGTLTAENMEEALKEIRLALLEADVNFKVVKDLIDHIRDKATGQEVLTSLSPAEMVIKVVRDELIETPVSYTHLDVYKRQNIDSAAVILGNHNLLEYQYSFFRLQLDEYRCV